MSETTDTIMGHLPDGSPIALIRLESDSLRVCLASYGARMLAIEAPDRQGRFDHVLLGFDDPDMMLKSGSFGAVIGRYSNRIAKGRFTLDGTTYQLALNNGPNTMHGGPQGFAKRLWTVDDRTARRVVFTLVSEDGDQGFPGTLTARATYEIDDETLSLTLEARTTKPTPVNLSAHPYFNLGGAEALDICDHVVEIAASHMLPTDAEQIPTGEIRPVAGTPLDFRAPVLLGSRIRGADRQMLYARGFDHQFVLDPRTPDRPAVRLIHPGSGRVLDITTSQIGVQVYTGNNLDGSLVGRGGTYRQSAGIAFEPQAHPNAPNEPGFPSTILRPGATYTQAIRYRFSRTDDDR